MRVVEEGNPCPRNFNPISWNRQGVQSLKGDTGAQGPQGPQGVPGQDGQDGQDATAALTIYNVRGMVGPIPPGGTVLVSALCHDGDRVLGGGFSATLNDRANPFLNEPHSDGGGWIVGARNVEQNPAQIVPTAVCLDRTP